MIDVLIPANYESIERLADWLQRHIPHEFNVDGGPRWKIVTGYSSWHIRFFREQDATLFGLLWKHQ